MQNIRSWQSDTRFFRRNENSKWRPLPNRSWKILLFYLIFLKYIGIIYNGSFQLIQKKIRKENRTQEKAMRPQTFQNIDFSWFFAKHRVSFQLFLTIWLSSFDTHAPARAASQLRTESWCNSRSIEPDVYTRNEWEPWKCATFEENIILFFCEHKHDRHDHGGPVSAKY